jgi:predicted O-methyltransferase YrrM
MAPGAAPAAVLPSLPACLPLGAGQVNSKLRRAAARLFGRDVRTEPEPHAGLDPLLAELGTGGWRVRHETAHALAHLMHAARPARVVEFGSGVSTVVFAWVARAAGIPARVVSFEEDPVFAARTRRLLDRHGLAERATVIDAPVAETTLDGWRGFAYRPAAERVDAALAGQPADFLFVDGPASWLRRRRDCRFGTLLLARRFAAPRTLFVADDAFRRGELAILKRWDREPGIAVLGVVPVGRGLGVGILTGSATVGQAPG